MPLSATVTFNDPSSAFAPYYADLTSNTMAAARRWGQYLDGNASLEIEISFFDRVPSAIASGGSEHSFRTGEWNGIPLWQMGAAHEIITGSDLNGALPDVSIDLDPNFLINSFWFDPTPDDHSMPPAGKAPIMSTLLHEIGHALGFSGWRDWSSGQLPGNFQSPFDALITGIDGFFYFTGENAVATYGGPVPLTSGSIFHYGNPAPGPGSELAPSGLLNGVVGGTFRDISPLDLAILQDLGLPVAGSVITPGHEVMAGSAGNDVLRGLGGADSLRGGSGNDTLEGGTGDDILIGGPGVDVGVFSDTRAAYSVSQAPTGYTVRQNIGADTDLVDVERLQFADKKIALDLGAGQSAGNAVRLIGAAFDAQFIPEYIGIGISLFDDGFSLDQIAQRALNMDLFWSLAGSRGNVDFVNTVYRNIVGQLPSDAERAVYVGLLQGSGGTMSQAELLALAANVPTNEINIGLAGLQQTGIEFV